jgi:hypothetical protein
MLAFLNANKTKITGAILTTLAFVQTNSALGTLLSPTAYAWTMFFVGLFVTFLGFLNNPTPPSGPVNKESGFSRPLMLAFLLAIAVPVTLALPGCGTTSAVKQAETPEQKAYALYGTYVIFQEKAAELVQDTATPESVKQDLREADKVAYPVAESLVDAVLEVEAIRQQISTGLTTEEKLTIAIQNLSTIYFTAAPKLLAVVAAVKGAK